MLLDVSQTDTFSRTYIVQGNNTCLLKGCTQPLVSELSKDGRHTVMFYVILNTRIVISHLVLLQSLRVTFEPVVSHLNQGVRLATES